MNGLYGPVQPIPHFLLRKRSASTPTVDPDPVPVLRPSKTRKRRKSPDMARGLRILGFTAYASGKLTRAEADWIIAKGTRFADWKAKR